MNNRDCDIFRDDQSSSEIPDVYKDMKIDINNL